MEDYVLGRLAPKRKMSDPNSNFMSPPLLTFFVNNTCTRMPISLLKVETHTEAHES